MKKLKPYSPSQLQLLAIFHGGGRFKTKALIRVFYRNQTPKHALEAMTFLLRKLDEKIKANGENFELKSLGYQGPRESQYWISEGKAP
jgi:hypothetical protein